MKAIRHANLWFPSYVRSRFHRHGFARPAKRIWLAHTDHFEPYGNTSLENAHRRMAKWQELWPSIAADAPRDAEGAAPCITFFYPEEEYERDLVASMEKLTRDRSADVEIHLHHFNDTAENFVAKVETFKKQLHEEHGLLHEWEGKLVFGFIHGNWALDNSHPQGLGCGVTGELQLLRDLGCYADFTMPSLPSPTQSRIVNQIYWTTGDRTKPRGFDSGVEVTEGGGRRGDLLMVTGPTGFRFRDRLMPRVETGELAAYDLPTPDRVKRWIDLAPRLGDDIFIKLYGHSAREDNAAALLGTATQPGALSSMYKWVAAEAEKRDLELHWVSAFDMFRAIHAIANGPAL